MTEEEAKTKWCPFSRVLAQSYAVGDPNKSIISAGASFNRQAREDRPEPRILSASACIGSACMAWREVQLREVTLDDGVAPSDSWTKGGLNGRLQEWYRVVGYCGLAGAP